MLTQCLLISTLSSLVTGQFQFADMVAVQDMTIELAQSTICGCIAILRPDNASEEQDSALEKLMFSLASGKSEKFSGVQFQTMLYTTEEYIKYYGSDLEQGEGSCFKWISIVMVTHTTSRQLQVVSNVVLDTADLPGNATHFNFLAVELLVVTQEATI